MSTDEILATPFVLIGTIDQIADQILRNRERYGFTYYTVHGPYADTFARLSSACTQSATDHTAPLADPLAGDRHHGGNGMRLVQYRLH
jgi:hypothetical protein